MLRLNSDDLSTRDSSFLARKQAQIDEIEGFEQRFRKAKSLWPPTARVTFRRIRAKLDSMSICQNICPYCEQSQPTDIEHIYPKRLFPEKTFIWENYLHACSRCNSKYKGDKFFIFDSPTSSNIIDVTPQKSVFDKPANADGAFINPRSENPMELLGMNIRTCIFTPLAAEGTRAFVKAQKTVEILRLNADTALVEKRERAVEDFVLWFRSYVDAKAANTFDELADAIVIANPPIDRTQAFIQEKRRILAVYPSKLRLKQHPTVWEELKRQRAHLPRVNELFDAAPEALDW